MFILKIALLIEEKADSKAIKLADRRPDLFEIVLDEKNTYKSISLLQMVNEILTKGIEAHLKYDRQIYLNILEKYKNQEASVRAKYARLLKDNNDFYEKKFNAIPDGGNVVQALLRQAMLIPLNQQKNHTIQELQKNQNQELSLIQKAQIEEIENIGIPNIWETFAKKIYYPSIFPFNIAFEKIKDLFVNNQSSFRELNKILEFQKIIDFQVTQPDIELSPERQSVLLQDIKINNNALSTDSLQKIAAAFGRENIDDFKNDFKLDKNIPIDFLLRKIDIGIEEFEELFELNEYRNYLSSNVKSEIVNLYIYSDDKKDHHIELTEDRKIIIANSFYTNANRKILGKVIKILCIVKWLNLTLWEVNLLLRNLIDFNNQGDISESTLKSIGYFLHLKDKYNLKAEDYVSWINKIPTIYKKTKTSHFDKIFNSNQESNLILDGFNFDYGNNEGKDLEILQIISSGLKTSITTLQSVLREIYKENGISLALTIDDISNVYRIFTIARTFGFSALELISICKLFKYKISDLKNHNVLYNIELFCDWLKEADISPMLFDFLFQELNIEKNNSKDVFDFAIEANDKIKIFEESADGALENSDLEKANKILLPLLEKSYKVSSEMLNLIFKWSDISILSLFISTKSQKNAKMIDDISVDYALLHFTIARYASVINFLKISPIALEIFIENPMLFGAENNKFNLKSLYLLWNYQKITQKSIYEEVENLDKNAEELIFIYFNETKNELDAEKIAKNSFFKLINCGKTDIVSFCNKFGLIKDITQINLLLNLKNLSKKIGTSILSLIQIVEYLNEANFLIYEKFANELTNKPSNNLEQLKRDVLVSYYLNHLIPNNKKFVNLVDYIKTPNDLYEYLLIDNQVSSEIVASPVSSAIASIQQFINGAILGIEKGQNIPSNIAADWEKNNKEYAIWAANVQLQNYPENFIEPSLRSNKSEFFQKLEGDLNQALDDEKIQKAVLTFLNNFEKISNLKKVSAYLTTNSGEYLKDGKLYIISKTLDEPKEYYVRSLDISNLIDGKPNPFAWNDYQKIELPFSENCIENTIRPVLFKGRLYVMYGEWRKESKKENDKTIDLDVIDLKIGYRAFDKTWSAPKTYISAKINKNLANPQKSLSIAFEVGNDKCLFSLDLFGYGCGCIIDDNFNIEPIYINIPNSPNGGDKAKYPGLFPDQIWNTFGYGSKKIQMKAINGVVKAPEVEISEFNDGVYGQSEFVRFTDKNYKPIRLNTTFAKLLVEKAHSSVFKLLSWETQNHQEPRLSNNDTRSTIDFYGANGKYFIELFFHLPFMIANNLKNEGKYTEAKEWLNIIFTPSAKNYKWNIKFLLDNNIAPLGDKANDPDSLASANPIYYKKSVFFLLISTLIAEADEQYRLLTPDSLTRAKQLYVQVLRVLGDLGYINLRNEWEPKRLQEALISKNHELRILENALINNQTIAQEFNDLSNMKFIASKDNPLLINLDNDLFRKPINSSLIGYWDTVKSRINNLRNNLTIDGKPLSIALFGSPMNPKDLLTTRLSGSNNITSILQSNLKIPPYRAQFMIDRAKEVVDTVVDFGDKLLSFSEASDDKMEQELDQKNIIELGNFGINLQQQSIKILETELKSLEIAMSATEQEYKYYNDLYNENLSPDEITGIVLRAVNIPLVIAGGVAEAIGEGLKIGPNIFGLAGGGMQYEGPPKAIAAGLKCAANIMDRAVDIVELNAGYKRRREEWKFSRNQAALNIEQYKNDLNIQKMQIEAARYSLDQMKREQTLMKEKYQFLRSKFTNKELYQWLVSQVSILYSQVYDAAVYMCLVAEACYRFENNDYTSGRFIQPGGVGGVYRGLLAGERLKLNLHQLEVTRCKTFERFIEIDHSIYLSELFSENDWQKALNSLKTSGELQFEFSEKVFAEKYPGHYYRQIYYMRIDVINDAKRNDGEEIHAILTQTSNVIVLSEDTATIDYLIDKTGQTPSSYTMQTNVRSGQMVVLSKVSDEFGFDIGKISNERLIDVDRYVPFEGAGLISKWHIKFTNEKAKNNILKDLKNIRFKIRYTALPGSPQFTKYVSDKLKNLS